MTPYQNCLHKTVLMKNHNLYFEGGSTKKSQDNHYLICISPAPGHGKWLQLGHHSFFSVFSKPTSSSLQVR